MRERTVREGEEKELFDPIFQSIMFKDYFMILADFESYASVQEQVSKDFLDKKLWAKKALYNIARSGKFSIDRTVKEYADDIWNVHSTL